MIFLLFYSPLILLIFNTCPLLWFSLDGIFTADLQGLPVIFLASRSGPLRVENVYSACSKISNGFGVSYSVTCLADIGIFCFLLVLLTFLVWLQVVVS